jgi:hypothetical protein
MAIPRGDYVVFRSTHRLQMPCQGLYIKNDWRMLVSAGQLLVGGRSGVSPPSCMRRRRMMLIKKINLAHKAVTNVATYVPPVET